MVKKIDPQIDVNNYQQLQCGEVQLIITLVKPLTKRGNTARKTLTRGLQD